MSMSKIVAENQIKLYNLGEQEGYRKALQVHNGGKVISDYDLITRTYANNDVRYPFIQKKDCNYCASKVFDEGIISFSVTGLVKLASAIIVKPVNASSDTNVIVNDDGSNLKWTQINTVVVDYNYTNSGNEEYSEANATFAKCSANVVWLNGEKTGMVLDNFVPSDSMYISGAMVSTNRYPALGSQNWYKFPEEYRGYNYIVFPYSTFDGAKKTVSFTVKEPVEVIVVSASNLTFADEGWEHKTTLFRMRYQNPCDPLSFAYMVNKGYLAISDRTSDDAISTRCRRFDALLKLEEDCGGKLGWVINPNRLAKTGFTANVNDFTYVEYLKAWVPYPCDGEYVVNTIKGGA